MAGVACPHRETCFAQSTEFKACLKCNATWVSTVAAVIRKDEAEWARFHREKNNTEAREHIAAVTHLKAQNVVGKGVAEEFMKKRCFCRLLSDISAMTDWESFLTTALKELKATLSCCPFSH